MSSQTPGLGESIKEVPGWKIYELRDGSPVNHIEADTFQIVRTQQIIRKIG